MKKLTLFAAACLFAAFSFAQDAGQWSFGAGGNFTAPDAEANIGYFAIDGLMLNFNFHMNNDYEIATYVMEDDGKGEMVATEAVDYTTTVEGDMRLGIGIRYYAVDNMFVEASMSTATDAEVDLAFAAGVSLELGFDGRLWFEPMIRFEMPGEEYGPDSQSNLGLAWAFRYTF